MPLEIVVILGSVVGGMTWMIVRAVRRQQAAFRLYNTIQQTEKPLLTLPFQAATFQLDHIGVASGHAHKMILALQPTEIVIYPLFSSIKQPTRLPLSELRWFGRPQKYQYGINEIWLHFEHGADWRILKVKLWQGDMQDFVREIKPLVWPELVTAYRRRRPYIHFGPVLAQPAMQDIHGAWTLDEPISLYIMPHALVILRDNKVVRVLALEIIQQIGALKRLDSPGADGLMRFQVEGEPFAFALPQYEQAAELLAQAARLTLEAPLERKQKGKEYEDDELYEGEL